MSGWCKLADKRIAVDFDGVIHSYISPFKNSHTIPDPPVNGALSWLSEATWHFEVVIFSARARGWRSRRAIRKWLRGWATDSEWEGIKNIKITNKKPAALVYIDDRAWEFNGCFPPIKALKGFRPWNK